MLGLLTFRWQHFKHDFVLRCSKRWNCRQWLFLLATDLWRSLAAFGFGSKPSKPCYAKTRNKKKPPTWFDVHLTVRGSDDLYLHYNPLRKDLLVALDISPIGRHAKCSAMTSTNIHPYASIQWSFRIQYKSVVKKHPNMTHTHTHIRLTNMSYIRLTNMSYILHHITYGPHIDTYGTGWLPGVLATWPGRSPHHRYCRLLGDTDVGPALGQHGRQDIEVQVRHFRQTLEARWRVYHEGHQG